jgi:FkbM family methyltransferase
LRAIGIFLARLIAISRHWGYPTGLKVAWSIFIKNSEKLEWKLPIFKNSISLRKAQSDLPIFEQIFADLEYKFPHPSAEEVTTIIDAGANIGFAALYMSTVYPNAKILCLEPDLNNIELLRYNTRNYTNIEILHGALWHNNSPIEISNPNELSAGFVITESKSNTTVIPAYTPKQLIEKMGGHVNLFKMDVEGAELEIFSNTTNWLNDIDGLIIELHDWMRPGCSYPFYKAIADFNWITHIAGENLVLLKQKQVP